MARHEDSELGCDGGAGAGGLGGTRALGNLMFPETSCFNWKASLSRRGGCPATTPQGEESVRAPSGKLLETRSKNGYSGFTGKEKRKGRDLMPLKAGSLCKENYCCCSEFKSGAEQSWGARGCASSRAGLSFKRGKMGVALHTPVPPLFHRYLLSTYSVPGWILGPQQGTREVWSLLWRGPGYYENR